jgi:hypothetical protein
LWVKERLMLDPEGHTWHFAQRMRTGTTA